jgi:hypothetical protein
MYKDVRVIEISEDPDGPARKKKVDPTADIKHFFSDPFVLEDHKKKRRHCDICGR